MQLQLAPILLNAELATRLTEKQKAYNAAHPDEHITLQQAGELMIEYAIRYLDITAIE